VGFLERDFERNHLAEKSNRTKMGQKIHCALAEKVPSLTLKNDIEKDKALQLV
jgi:hypothetical protein